MAITPPFFEAGNVSFEHVFSGTYFQKIDKFHRISLPKELRTLLLLGSTRVPAWVLWKSNHVNAIEATTEDIFSNSVQKSLGSASEDELSKIRQTAAVYANVYKVYDRDGRMTIPMPLQLGLQFENTIVIVGMGAFFHIWPSAEYDRFYRPAGNPKPAEELNDINAQSEKIRALVSKALAHFIQQSDTRPGDPLPIERIGAIIEELTGERLYEGALRDIRDDMLERQRNGQGVRALSTSGEVWSLGPNTLSQPD